MISNATFSYDNNGKLKAEGETSHMTYMGIKNNKTMENKLNSFIKLEIDNELIQGSVLEVEYEILFNNKSELDYNLESYYLYGRINSEQEKQTTLIKIKPSTIIDYLDKDWSYEESKNSDGRWVVKTKQELETQKLVDENVYKDQESEIENKTILITDKLNKEFAPGERESISLNVSKILTITDELELDNDTEIIKVEKPQGGRPIPLIPGKYIPGKSELNDLSDKAERIMVTPSTGKDLNFIVPITVGIIALITLGAGVILIKKKVVDNK